VYTLADACNHCAQAYNPEDIIMMEMLILNTLKWKIHYSTPGEIARRILHCFNSVINLDLPLYFKKIDDYIDRIILPIEFTKFAPSTIAFASVMMAFEDP